MVQSFFRFTIQGDDFEPEVVQKEMTIPCEIFRKGDTKIKQYLEEHEICQKTNRLVYSAEVLREEGLDGFLTRNLKAIETQLPVFKSHIANNTCSMELVIYAGDKTDIQLTQEQIELIQKIGVGIHISFC